MGLPIADGGRFNFRFGLFGLAVHEISGDTHTSFWNAIWKDSAGLRLCDDVTGSFVSVQEVSKRLEPLDNRYIGICIQTI